MHSDSRFQSNETQPRNSRRGGLHLSAILFVAASAACGGADAELEVDSLSELTVQPSTQGPGYPITLDADGHFWSINFNPNYGQNGSVTTVCPDGTEVPVRVSSAGGGTFQYSFSCPPLPGSQYWQHYLLYANAGTGNAWGFLKRSPWWVQIEVFVAEQQTDKDDV